jgi:hypothetical protein
LEQGFAPKVSRVLVGVCVFAGLWLAEHEFGYRGMIGAIFLICLMLMLLGRFPTGSRSRRFVGWVLGRLP